MGERLDNDIDDLYIDHRVMLFRQAFEKDGEILLQVAEALCLSRIQILSDIQEYGMPIVTEMMLEFVSHQLGLVTIH